MKKIRMICAGLTVCVMTAFGGMAWAADTPSELPQQKTPLITQAGAQTVNQTVNQVEEHMLKGYGEVTELSSLEMDSCFIVVKPEDGTYPEIRLNIFTDTKLLDNKTGQEVELADIKVGDRVYVYYSPAMTRSIPPQSAMYLLLTEVEEGTPAQLWTVEGWDGDTSGDLVVTADNGGLLIRIPQTAWLENKTAPQLKEGQRFLAWYDVVALSYPGLATANKAMLLETAPVEASEVEASDAEADCLDDEEQPVEYVSTVTSQAVVREVVNNADEKYLLVARQDGSEIQLNFATEGENKLLVVDAQTGAMRDLSSVQPGSQVVVNHNMAATFSLPPQSWLNYLLVNPGENPPAGLFFVEEEARLDDGGRRVLTDNGGLWITIPKEVWQDSGYSSPSLGAHGYFLAWYDVVMESYPGQTTATKILPVAVAEEPSEQNQPEQNQSEQKIVEAGDLSISNSNDLAIPNLLIADMLMDNAVHYQSNGVAMVPLRFVAENLGFDVKWEEDGAGQRAHLTNGQVQTTVTVGQDSYYRATAVPGMVGMTAPQSLQAAPVMIDDLLYVPAGLFELLGFEVTVSGNAIKIG